MSDRTQIAIDYQNRVITFNDDFASVTTYFHPETTKYEVSVIFNNDAYFRKSIYEYRINSNTVSVQERLLERSDEPPLKYLVKDGVVLEPETSGGKRMLGQRLREELEKEVEWHDLHLPGAAVVFYYILSLHTDIVPIEETRKIVRKSEQKIRSALMQIKEYLATNDKTGLEIIDYEDATSLWYSKDDGLSEKEKENRLIYVDSLYGILFDEKSKSFCGISLYEFRASKDNLERIALVLDEKPVNNPVHVKSKNNHGWSWAVVIVLSLLAMYWGVWTAIGVFILGAIIISLIKKEN